MSVQRLTAALRRQWVNNRSRPRTDTRRIELAVQRSYLDFYVGFGWTLSVYLLLQTVLLWQIATLNKAAPASARPMIAAFVVANALGAALAGQFIFAVPMVSFLAIAGCLVIA